MGPSCPYKVYNKLLLNKSHILIVESREQLTKYCLPGWKEIDVTALLWALIFLIDCQISRLTLKQSFYDFEKYWKKSRKEFKRQSKELEKYVENIKNALENCNTKTINNKDI